MPAMTIGQLAKAAGVNVETVRYYQRRGLLDIPAKPAGGQRRYSERALQRLTFIRNAQGLAFTLEEIARLLSIADTRGCRKVRAVAHDKLQHLAQRAAEIKLIERRLRLLIRRCDGRGRGSATSTVLALIAGQAHDSHASGSDKS